MRGGSVGVLVILVSEETGDEFTVVVRQPRLPVGSYDSIEIPVCIGSACAMVAQLATFCELVI